MFDIESFLEKLEANLAPGLNAAIAAINTEKGGDAIVSQIPLTAWISGSLDDRVKNFKDFAFYYVDDITSEISGPISANRYVIEIDLFVYDRQDNKTQKRTMRIHRALMEAVAKSWDKVGVGYDRAKMQSLTPIDIKLNNSSFFHKVIGINLEFTISN